MSEAGRSFGEDFSFRIVDNLNGFERLKFDWNNLAEKSRSYLPWLSWEWFDLCIKHFFAKDKFVILLLYQEGRIVGIAPFIVRREVFKGVFSIRKVELMGNHYSPIRKFIGSDQVTDPIMLNSLEYFCNRYKDWDILEFDSLPEESDIFKAVENRVWNYALRNRAYFCFGNWYLDGINYKFDEYFGNLPKRITKDIQYCKRSLQKKGNLRFEMIKDIRSADHYLKVYDQLREKSWKAPEKDAKFHREFEKLAADQGWLRLGFLFHDDNPIAAQKWIVCNKIAYILAVLYHEGYNKFSPGKILTSEIARKIIDEDKVVEIDFMRGDDAYKRDWTPKRRERKGISLFNYTAKGQLLAFLITKALPAIERNRYTHLAKIRLGEYLKRSRQE